MALDHSSLAYAAQASATESGARVIRTHALEVLAALLGFGTYAALREHDRTANPEDALERSEMICLQSAFAAERAHALGLPEQVGAKLIVDLVEGVRRHFGTTAVGTAPKIYASTKDLLEGEQSDGDLYDRVAECDEIYSEFASTNASYDYFEIEELVERESILKCDGAWVLEGIGTASGEHDPDTVWHGDTIDVSFTCTYEVVGRVGLVLLDDEVVASIEEYGDDSDG